ncbi:hypothetical protein BVER_01598 [Candidatus Burkholderia verschuerenii]|uniref:DUF2380 domain-containing protein n=1 Tax=Candidatus Burkholderia verschuerenii TaxID=242163 RepID=A0A0L0MJA4_9BURK|nr:DUF3280 domain-containing protein [Candidatus Burkholderia verschuerenii]KND62395.1 hypothetical protein BVER_01598 [Candidatus Burkholderia verschuerenii]
MPFADRLPLFFVSCVLVVLSLADARAEGARPSIALLDCTLIDDNAAYNDDATNRTQAQRLAMISNALRDDLRQRALFDVTDNAPANELIASLRSTQDMSACNGCELRVAKQLGVSRVGVCWVQKISNLILNINLRVEDASNGKAVFQRSVDMRGNTDLSWQRAGKALIDLVAADPSATR